MLNGVDVLVAAIRMPWSHGESLSFYFHVLFCAFACQPSDGPLQKEGFEKFCILYYGKAIGVDENAYEYNVRCRMQGIPHA